MVSEILSICTGCQLLSCKRLPAAESRTQLRGRGVSFPAVTKSPVLQTLSNLEADSCLRVQEQAQRREQDTGLEREALRSEVVGAASAQAAAQDRYVHAWATCASCAVLRAVAACQCHTADCWNKSAQVAAQHRRKLHPRLSSSPSVRC